MAKRIEVNVVAYEQGGLWVAQCVEYDIAAFAKSFTELPNAFERAVAANVCANADLGRDALDGIPTAPARFRALFDAAQFDVKPTHKSPGPNLPVKIRDLRVAAEAA